MPIVEYKDIWPTFESGLNTWEHRGFSPIDIIPNEPIKWEFNVSWRIVQNELVTIDSFAEAQPLEYSSPHFDEDNLPYPLAKKPFVGRDVVNPFPQPKQEPLSKQKEKNYEPWDWEDLNES